MKLSFKILSALVLAGLLNQLLFILCQYILPYPDSTLVLLSRGSGILIGYAFTMNVFKKHYQNSRLMP